MQQRKFTVLNDSHEKLVVIEVLPDSYTDTLPVVLLCHGFAYYKEEDGLFTTMAERLAAKGYAAYYFDFSGCGESEGDYSKTTLTKLVADLRSVYAHLQTIEYLDTTDLSLIGQSFGTNVAIANNLAQKPQRIVLCGSFVDPYAQFKFSFDEFNPHGISRKVRSNGRFTDVGEQFFADFTNFDLVESIKTYHCPILFIHGKLDGIVPMSSMEPLFHAAENAVGPVILPNSDHGLAPEQELAFTAVTDFFPVAN